MIQSSPTPARPARPTARGAATLSSRHPKLDLPAGRGVRAPRRAAAATGGARAGSPAPVAAPSPAAVAAPVAPQRERGAGLLEPAGTRPAAPLRVQAAPTQRWRGVAAAGAAGLVLAALAGSWQFPTTYTATLTLLGRELPSIYQAGDVGAPAADRRRLPAPALASAIQARTFLAQVAQRADPPVSAEQLQRNLSVEAEADADLVTVRLTTTHQARTATGWLEVYGEEVVRRSKELQAQAAVELNEILQEQLVGADRELAAANQQLETFARQAQLVDPARETAACLRDLGDFAFRHTATRIELDALAARIATIERAAAADSSPPPTVFSRADSTRQQLQTAQTELVQLLSRYTDANPLVMEARERVRLWEEQVSTLAIAPDPPPAAPVVRPTEDVSLADLKAQQAALSRRLEQYAVARDALRQKYVLLAGRAHEMALLQARQQSLGAQHAFLFSQQRMVQSFVEAPPGDYRVFSLTPPSEVAVTRHWTRIALSALAGAGLAASLAWAVLWFGGRSRRGSHRAASLNRVASGALVVWGLSGWGLVPLAPARAGETPLVVTPPTAQAGLSKVPGAGRADWQRNLKLGPGDVLDLELYGFPELARPGVVITAEGRISYLEAREVPAEGLSVDELRERLDDELRRHFRFPRVIILPVAYHSQRCQVLGDVHNPGTYTLERPVTLLEALRRAQGLVTGWQAPDDLDRADLARSLVLRRGARLPVDLRRLFDQGDLSQDLELEPGDAIYVSPASSNEISVLGEVVAPGRVGADPTATLPAVLASCGGLTPKAFNQRVLVLRGALSRPETFVVNLPPNPSARRNDFQLQAKDIVYVADRPWRRAEELLDQAAAGLKKLALTHRQETPSSSALSGLVQPTRP